METSTPTGELLRLALELAGSLDQRTVMRRILDRSLELAAADRATLSRIAGDQLIIEATVGTGGEVTWVGREYGSDSLLRQPLVQQLIETRRAVLGGPMATSEALPEFRGALDRVRHTATVPILEGGELRGMLVLSRYDDRPFVPDDVPNLTAFGALAGLAMRNATLYDEATAARRGLEAAADAAADVAALPELAALLQRIIEHACEAAGASSGAIMHLEEGAGIVDATSGIAPVGSRWPLAPEVRAAIADGRPIQVTTADEEVHAGLEGYVSPYSHALVEPLQFAGNLLGILVLGRFHGLGPFGPREVTALRQFAALAAVVLHNGRLVHRLREAEKMKREFMDIAVHELRGPLTVIEGYTELLLRDEAENLDPEGLRQLTTIRRQAGHARTLAEDLLVLARVESDDIGVARESIDVGEHVGAAVDRAAPRARLRGGSVGDEGDGSARVLGDPALLDRILDNLLSNAIAYSIERPRVTVSVVDDGQQVSVRVQDNGPGVIEDERERIFARFARGTHIGGTRGSGLGLHLSRECARRMGGDLVLEDSDAARGSRFLLTLPSA